MTFAVQATFKDPEAAKERRTASGGRGAPGGGDRRRYPGGKGPWPTTPSRSFRPPGSSASRPAAVLIGGLFWYGYWGPAVEHDDQDGAARSPPPGDPAARGDRNQAPGLPARGRPARGQARDADADTAAREGDARPDAQGAVAGRAEPTWSSVTSRRAPRSTRSSTRSGRSTSPSTAATTTSALLRPGDPAVAAGERGQPQDQRRRHPDGSADHLRRMRGDDVRLCRRHRRRPPGPRGRRDEAAEQP